MSQGEWFKVFPGSITVTDREGKIVEMNDQAIAGYLAGGGGELLGKNAITCHQEPIRSQVQKMYDDPAASIYTLQENGQKQIVYHAPYFIDSQFAGIVELCFKLPETIPHIEHSS